MAYAVPFLTLLIGILLGHWIALGRDRRQELNQAALPVRTWIVAELNGPSPYSAAPSAIEIDIFVQRLPWHRRARFKAAWELQQAERNKVVQQDTFGQVSYSETAGIVAALRKCLHFTAEQ